MQALSNREMKSFEQLVKLKQLTIKKVMSKYLKDKYDQVIETPEYIMAIGNIPVALVAHMDTVFKQPPNEIFYDRQKNVIWSPEGLGADDRAGIYAIIKILQAGYRPHIILTTDEECGAFGASAIVAEHEEFPADLKYLIELDRRGTNDCVFYDCENTEFANYVESFGFCTRYGSFTDISILCPYWGIAGVNLSIGYEDEHSEAERLYVSALFDTIKKVQKMLDDAVNVKGPYIYVSSLNSKYFPAYDKYWYSGYDYPSESCWSGMYKCKKCHKTFAEIDIFPTDAIDGGTVFYCGDCIANNEEIGWCAICGQPFERKSTKDIYCKICAKKREKEAGIKDDERRNK